MHDSCIDASVSVPLPDDLVERVRALVKPGETGVPPIVWSVAQQLSERGVWFRLSRNLPARSCRDAAQKRCRLGHEGIELWEELKSFFGVYADIDGRESYLVAHVRADQLLDMESLASALGTDEHPDRVSEHRLAAMGLEYGLINPFIECVIGDQKTQAPVLQVFDSDLCEPLGTPGTVTTNAGDLEWAVEFDIPALIATEQNCLLADISAIDLTVPSRSWGTRAVGGIGIITGNAPESGIALWQSLNRNVRALLGSRCLGDISMPRVTIESLPLLGLTMELEQRHEKVWSGLEPLVESMCRRGLQVLAIACHTTHFFTPRIRAICEAHDVEFLSMAEILAEWLHHHEVKKIALIGIQLVSALGEWSAYRDSLAGIEVERLSTQAIRRIDKVAYLVKAEGADVKALNRLRDILRKEVESQQVVLALTELSLLLAIQRKPGRSGKTIVDPLELCGKALACRYLDLPFIERNNASKAGDEPLGETG